MDPVSDSVRKHLEIVDATRGLTSELRWNDWKRWYAKYSGRVLFSFECQGEVDEYVQYTGLKYNIVPPAVESHHRRALESVLRDRDLCVFVANEDHLLVGHTRYKTVEHETGNLDSIFRSIFDVTPDNLKEISVKQEGEVVDQWTF